MAQTLPVPVSVPSGLTWTETGVGAKPQRTNAWLAACAVRHEVANVIEENLLAERQLDVESRLFRSHHQLIVPMRW
jgi:hypothetical protein